MEQQNTECCIFGDFIASSQKLHTMSMERLQNTLVTIIFLKPITCIVEMPLQTIAKACGPLGLAKTAEAVLQTAANLPAVGNFIWTRKGSDLSLHRGLSLLEIESSLEMPGPRESEQLYLLLTPFHWSVWQIFKGDDLCEAISRYSEGHPFFVKESIICDIVERFKLLHKHRSGEKFWIGRNSVLRRCQNCSAYQEIIGLPAWGGIFICACYTTWCCQG